MSTISFFQELCFCFESKPLNNAFIPVPDLQGKDGYFGIIKVGAMACPETTKPQNFLFVIDCSGSMSDCCFDGRSKMQHTKHTLKNMISYFCDKPFITVTICVFDDKFDTIINKSVVNKSNLNQLYTYIDEIQPRGTTNIENALIQSNKIVSLLTNSNTNFNLIFMTDGSVTAGSNNINVLKNLINSSIKNVFIGFGIQHDASLLNFISNKQNTSYYFIDKLEKAGLVYGEIIHNIMYNLLNNAQITVTDGYIYNYKSNQWSTELDIGSIIGETNKIYHIVSDTPETCQILLTCKNQDETQTFHVSKLIEIVTDYTKYVYRQRVLQLLYEINEVNFNNHYDYNLNCLQHIEYHPQKKENNVNSLKYKINSLLEELKTYMETNNLTDDNYYKNLCNDLIISYKTIGTKYGTMYTSARQTSQGTQRYYTVNRCPDKEFNTRRHIGSIQTSIPRRLGLNRSPTIYSDNNADDVFKNFNYAPLSLFQDDTDDFKDMAYVTPTAINIMRDISNNIDIKDDSFLML